MDKAYNKIRVGENLRKYEVDGRPVIFVSQSNAPFYNIIRSSLEDSLPHLVENPEDVVVDHDLLENAGLQNLTELLYVTEGFVSGMNVLDLGCGSTEQKDYHSNRWLPYMAEVLTRLGARVTGIDYRPNPKATYNHRIVDLMNDDITIEGNFDLIITKSLHDGLVGGASNPDMESRILEIVGGLLRSDQLMITDLDATHFGFRPVFFRGINTLSYR